MSFAAKQNFGNGARDYGACKHWFEKEFLVGRSSDEFILLLTRAQPIIYACIHALLPDRIAAQEILQETNRYRPRPQL